MIKIEIPCQQCTSLNNYILSQDNTQQLLCSKCGWKIGSSAPNKGFLYALDNESMPGLLKIGFTSRPIAERVIELNSSTSTPTPFNIAFYFTSDTPQQDEAHAHEELKKFRINQGREFFRITTKDALFKLRKAFGREEVFLDPTINLSKSTELFFDEELDEQLKIEITKTRPHWKSTGGAVKGISLIYRLKSQQKIHEAIEVANLFLEDNPDHIKAVSILEELKKITKHLEGPRLSSNKSR